jgi:serine/threonine protein kinase
MHSTPHFRSTDGKYAVKIIRPHDEEYQQIALKEYKLVRKLNHPGIIKMVDAFVNSQKGTIYLVMQLVQGLTIRKYVKRQQKKRIEGELQH